MTDKTKQEQGFGVNVWWTVPDIAVDGIKAQTALKKHGFDEKSMKLPTKQAEVSRAVNSFHNRRSRSDRRIGERVGETADTVTYGILDREQKDASEVAFEQHTTVVFDKDSEKAKATGSLKAEFDKALAEYEGKVTDQDVRTFLRKVIRMCWGVAKRPTGGIYFVPAKFAGIVDEAQAVLNDLNSAAHIYVERVMDGPQERQNVWSSVEDEVEDRVAKAIAAVGRIERRKSALSGQEQEIRQAEELMEVYKGLLGQEAKYEALAEKIEEAVKTVSEKLASIPDSAPKVKSDGNRAKKGTVADAAIKVLTEAGKSLSCREIVDTAVKQGMYPTTNYNSFAATLQRAIKLGEKRVRKIGRGMYELAA